MNEIENLNKLNETEFKATPYKDRAIFLPQCLRNPECKAPTTEDGILCLSCGKCNISGFKKEAETLGYKFFIVPGFSLTKKLIRIHKPKAVLGVGCIDELNEAKDAINKINIVAQGLPLLKDGCVNTEVDWKKLKEMIK
jgi:hypothetical protein